MPDHLSRKELKQDKIRESLEHGAEAVYSHSQAAAILVGVVLAVVLIYGGWKFYSDRQTVLASAALDDAMKIYNAPIRRPIPLDPRRSGSALSSRGSGQPRSSRLPAFCGALEAAADCGCTERARARRREC